MTDYLEDLLAGARKRVAAARRDESADDLRARAEVAPPPASFRAGLLRPGVSVIAEIKRSSPSAGELAPGLDVSHQVRAYLGGGAAAISVLTEPDRFGGSLDDLRRVAQFGAPALRKDFVIDPYQVWEAKVLGAAAVLVVVKALDDTQLAGLMDAVRRARLDALVEVHDEQDLERAAGVDAQVVGVNARDLRTFEVDPEAFARLAPSIPDGVLVVAESGITGPGQVRAVAAHDADAVLVGEALVTAEDPRQAVADLVAAGREGG